MLNEHIVIADELFDHSIEPTRVNRREKIRNRVSDVVTELVFYDEGFLRVCEMRKAKRYREHLLELQFLDPDPIPARRTATGILLAALGLSLSAMLAAFVLPMTDLSQYTVSATAVLGVMAFVALLFSIRRSAVRYQFFTANGKAIVLTLTASFGCIRHSRAVARAISDAIRLSRRDTLTENADYLRAEMKAHYKLAETGVITREACADGTTQILSRFG